MFFKIIIKNPFLLFQPLFLFVQPLVHLGSIPLFLLFYPLVHLDQNFLHTPVSLRAPLSLSCSLLFALPCFPSPTPSPFYSFLFTHPCFPSRTPQPISLMGSSHSPVFLHTLPSPSNSLLFGCAFFFAHHFLFPFLNSSQYFSAYLLFPLSSPPISLFFSSISYLHTVWLWG